MVENTATMKMWLLSWKPGSLNCSAMNDVKWVYHGTGSLSQSIKKTENYCREKLINKLKLICCAWLFKMVCRREYLLKVTRANKCQKHHSGSGKQSNWFKKVSEKWDRIQVFSNAILSSTKSPMRLGILRSRAAHSQSSIISSILWSTARTAKRSCMQLVNS